MPDSLSSLSVDSDDTSSSYDQDHSENLPPTDLSSHCRADVSRRIGAGFGLNCIMSEAIGESFLAVRSLGARTGSPAMPSPTSRNETWVPFNKEILQSIFDNTVMMQISSEREASERSSRDRHDSLSENSKDSSYASSVRSDRESVEKDILNLDNCSNNTHRTSDSSSLDQNCSGDKVESGQELNKRQTSPNPKLPPHNSAPVDQQHKELASDVSMQQQASGTECSQTTQPQTASPHQQAACTPSTGRAPTGQAATGTAPRSRSVRGANQPDDSSYLTKDSAHTTAMTASNQHRNKTIPARKCSSHDRGSPVIISQERMTSPGNIVSDHRKSSSRRNNSPLMQGDTSTMESHGKKAKYKVRERQPWVGISKAALEDIVDELVISTMSGDDSNPNSRSQTPCSDISTVSQDSRNAAGCCSPRHINSPERNINSPNGEKSDEQVSVISVTDSASEKSTSLGEDSKRSMISRKQPTVPHMDLKEPVDFKDVANKDMIVNRHEKTNKDNNVCPNETASNDMSSKGWVVLDKPLISSMMESAFASFGNDEENASDKEQQSPRRSSVCSSESSDVDVVHVDEKESYPQSDIVNMGSKGPDTNQELNRGNDTNNVVLNNTCTAAKQPPETAWPSATALLLGAICLGENKNAEPRKRQSSSDVQPEISKCARQDTNVSENGVIDLRIPPKKVRAQENPLKEQNLQQNEMERNHMLQNLLSMYHRQHAMGLYPGPPPSMADMAAYMAKVQRENPRFWNHFNRPGEVIDVEHLGGMNSGQNPMNLINYRSLSGPRGPPAATMNLATPKAHRQARSAPIVGGSSRFSKQKSPNLQNQHQNRSFSTSQSDVIVLDGTPEAKDKNHNSDLNGNQERISQTQTETPRFDNKEVTRQGVRSRASPSSQSSNKTSPRPKSKEPHHGWVVISKDEVHMILDSLTSQLFTEDEKEDNTPEKRSSLPELKSPANSKSAQASSLRDDPSGSGTRSTCSAAGPNNKIDSLQLELLPVEAEGRKQPDNATSCHHTATHSQPESQEEAFRRTTMDALNVVYHHEDTLESESTKLSDEYQSPDMVDKSASNSQGSNHSYTDSFDSEQSGSMSPVTIIRQPPVHRVSGEQHLENLDSQPRRMSQTDSSGVSDEAALADLTPDAQDGSRKYFKWKRSILQRVQDDFTPSDAPLPPQANDPSNSPPSGKLKRKLSQGTSNKRTKRSNKRR